MSHAGADAAGFAAELRGASAGIPVSDGMLDRAVYARDASPQALLEWRDGTVAPGPDLVCWPADVLDVVRVVRAAAKHRLAVVAYGAGSGVVRGILPRAGAVVLDTKRLDRVAVDARRRVATVGAGVIGERLERALNTHGFTAGHFPSSIYCSTVGGWVAARSAGQLSSRYGKIEDMVVGLQAVDGAGRVLELRRETDDVLMRAIIGSEGSLAVVTQVTLRVQPVPTHHVLWGLEAANVDAGLAYMKDVMRAGLRPSVLRMYDAPDTFLAGGIPADSEPPAPLPGAISRSGNEYASAARTPRTERNGLFHLLQRRVQASARSGRLRDMGRRFLSGALGRTSLLEFPYQHLPERCLMVLGLEGDPATLEADMAACMQMTTGAGVRVVGRAPGERWLRRRHAVTYLMPPFLRQGVWADTLEVSAAWSVIPELYREARAAMLRHAVVLAHFSHAYAEGGSIYFTMAGAGADLHESVERHDAAVDAALAVFSRLGASLSHHHGVGRAKAAWLWRTQGEGARDAVLRLKRVMDPDGILNPGVLAMEAA